MKKLVSILATALALSHFVADVVGREPSLTEIFNRIYAVGTWGTLHIHHLVDFRDV
jgi:hypothetical protein